MIFSEEAVVSVVVAVDHVPMVLPACADLDANAGNDEIRLFESVDRRRPIDGEVLAGRNLSARAEDMQGSALIAIVGAVLRRAAEGNRTAIAGLAYESPEAVLDIPAHSAFSRSKFGSDICAGCTRRLGASVGSPGALRSAQRRRAK